MSKDIDGGPSDCLKDVEVVILAGGLGTRLADAVPNMPKALAPIAGVPFIEIQLNWLRRFGARRIVFALGHRAGQIADHFTLRPPEGLDCTIVVEPEPLGTSGALAFIRDRLTTETVVVLNGDSFVDADLCQFLAAHQSSGALASLLCTEVEDASRFGTVVRDSSGRLSEFREKQPGAGPGVINAGVYIMQQAFLDMVVGLGESSLEHGVFGKLPAGTLNVHAGSFPFIDIGTPEDYVNADDVLAPYLPN